MTGTIRILIIVIGCFYATAQNTISLEQAELQIRNNGKIADDVSSILDLNNTYDPFLGNWRGSYNGKTVILTIYKQVSNYDTIITEDLLVYQKITDSIGNVVFDDTSDDMGSIFSDGLMSGTVTGFFIDDNECSLKMHAYFTLLRDMNSSTVRLGVEFYDGHGTINGNACPNGPVPTIHPDGTMFEATRI